MKTSRLMVVMMVVPEHDGVEWSGENTAKYCDEGIVRGVFSDSTQ